MRFVTAKVSRSHYLKRIEFLQLQKTMKMGKKLAKMQILNDHLQRPLSLNIIEKLR